LKLYIHPHKLACIRGVCNSGYYVTVRFPQGMCFSEERVFVKTNGDAQTEYVIHGRLLQPQLKNWSPL